MRRRGPILSAVRLNVNIASSALLFEHYNRCRSIHLVVTGGPISGTFKLQISNDVTDDVDQVASWSDLADSSQAIVAVGQIFYNLKDQAEKWVRVVYTSTSGDGYVTGNYY